MFSIQALILDNSIQAVIVSVHDNFLLSLSSLAMNWSGSRPRKVNKPSLLWMVCWCLDVAFREDECRVRIVDAAENFSLLRKIALTCLKKESSLKGGIQTKRLKAGWDLNYLIKVLNS